MERQPSYETLKQQLDVLETAEKQRQKAMKALKEKAERLLQNDGVGDNAYTDKSVDHLINELNVHQVELEIQNEELRASQEKLQHSRNRLLSFFQKAPVGYVILDRNGMIRDTNQTLSGMIQKDLKTLIDTPFQDLIVPQDRPLFHSRFRSFFKAPESKSLEMRLVTSQKDLFYAQLKGSVINAGKESYDNQGPHILVAIQDISKEKAAEARERHTQQILRAIRTISQMITTETDRHRLIQLACNNLTQEMGYHNAWIALFDDTQENVIMTAFSGIDDKQFLLMQQQFEKKEFSPCMHRIMLQQEMIVIEQPTRECPTCPLSGGYSNCSGFVQRLEFRDKLYGVLAVSVPKSYANYKDEQHLFQEVCRDLSFALDRIEASNAHRQAAEIIERSPAVALIWKNETGWPVTFASNNTQHIFGQTKEALLTNEVPFSERVHPDDLDRVSREVSIGCSEKSHQTIKHAPYRIIRSDDTVRWISDKTYIRRDQNGDVIQLEGILLDITDLKQAETNLKSALERQHAVFETAMVGIVVLHDRVITSVNKRFGEMLGYSPDELTGQTPEMLHLTHENFVEFGEKYYGQLGQKDILQLEYPLRHKNGKKVLCQFSGRAISPPDLDQGAVWIIDDITERRLMEKRVYQMKKAESLSRMAGSVAHHFNNILMVTMGNLEIAQDEIPFPHAAAYHIKEAYNAARRAVEVSQLMLTYLGQNQQETDSVNLVDLIIAQLTQLKQQLPRQITLTHRIATPQVIIKGDRMLLDDLLDIVSKNSMEALEGQTEGEIIFSLGLKTGSDIQGAAHLFPNEWQPDGTQYACLTISDTGKGISENQIDMIFDPFYSDKFTGRGLGLAVALGIVKSHEGCIIVESDIGKGTDMAIFLPIHSKT